ncbi:uncharacterized protein PADG_11108 [Paracoccidioides brasiliensis Pb18]|uniref:Beta-lactamase-related domain-containing protein n=1 Tax=Paracoccidioides brasiliensis (strain Pb18) TaxID=502780 RepID=A0A0A0HZ76_PARBD|nr:uncharacterized protein PADG_11108 [Paracoccidioides brasiliensis Pb18]KGM92655.1 hypothetical protein PADG_11108 [Paracoccidioides brasiliensis Pb18]
MGKDISPECVSLIRQALEDACADQERGIPGVTFLVANRDGKQIFAHAAGKRGKGVNEPMALDSMITGIACKQLVEQGKLSLDDAEQVEGICPELKDLKVVQKYGSFCGEEKGHYAEDAADPYCLRRHLTTLLNDGTSPKTGQQLLTKSTVDQMFENQIPHIPNFGRQDTHLNAKPDFVKNVPDFYPLNNNEPQGWGLSFMITSSVTCRSLKSGMWAGIANLFWWCDREHGIAGVISTQILPFGDVKLFGLWADVEKKVYDSLK